MYCALVMIRSNIVEDELLFLVVFLMICFKPFALTKKASFLWATDFLFFSRYLDPLRCIHRSY